jgi:hypothetical protein
MGMNGALRGFSHHKLTVCDLNLTHGFGPEIDGPLSHALLLVLCQGDVRRLEIRYFLFLIVS